MNNRKTLLLSLGLIIILCLAASGRKIDQPILVVIQPEAEYLGSVRASITNHSAHKIWFASCPDPYTVHLTDSSGELVPYRPVQKGQIDLPLCGRNILYTIQPSETWSMEVPIHDKFDLKPDTYSVTLLWHFPWNVRKTDQGATTNTLTVSSNTIPLTITH